MPNCLQKKELEETLIHFTHARRLWKAEKKNSPVFHNARFTSEYLTHLENLASEISKNSMASSANFRTLQRLLSDALSRLKMMGRPFS